MHERKEGEFMMESMLMMAAAVFFLLVLADFSLAEAPQDRISGRIYARFLSDWQTVSAAFSKKSTLEKLDTPAIYLSDPPITGSAFESPAVSVKNTTKYSAPIHRQKLTNSEPLLRKQYNRKMMEN